MPKWTEEQEQAINLEGCNILVSAGAGSGKTAVLSERALRKVKEGVNIDEVLILTFTKAAAYEMMLRIRDKIQKNGFKEQVNRIDKAYITTFDSFALSIVRKYHDRLNLKKDVSIIDENAISLLKTEILDEIFDEYYHAEDDKFLDLITDFSLRDDKEIKKYILSINNKLDLKYDKNEYLNEYLDWYYNRDNVNKRVEEYELVLFSIIDKIKLSLDKLQLILDGDDYVKFSDTLDCLVESRTYDEVKKNIGVKLPRLPKNSGDDAKNSKKEIETYLDELEKLTIFESKERMISEYLSTYDYVKIMIDIIKKLDSKINSYKMENNVFEFVDISKLAIDLVVKYQDIRDELKNYFNEIMIDEYQDTSDLQEQFINLIENNNVYMVGDIKQSIYRFRNANPLIFKQKYDSYAKGIGGKKIDLNKNFRSRREVLDNINQFFDYIMDDDFGGANYQESHRMVFGNNTYINEGLTEQNYNVNIYNYKVDNDSKYKKYTKDEIEAFIIASDIKKKVDDKYQVFDKDSCILRDINYGDFVILMDRSSKFTLYKKIFEYMKIPLTILKDENIMDQNEVYLIKNILKLVECLDTKQLGNSFKYSFTSIARSYLFSYSDDKIFHIINNDLYFETDIIKKAKVIVDSLSKVDLKGLVDLIIDEFNFYETMITYGNVSMGLTVLEYFQNLADSLQSIGYDYHRFIIYLDYIIDSGKEIKIPVSISNSNSCQIMTIHKSKGLEYPICYYSGLSMSFNIGDLKDKVLFDNEYGIITPSFINGYQDTFCKMLLKKKYLNEEISEKIRLFYVALTRCKEQMIVVTSLDDEQMQLENGLVSTTKREQYRSFLDILKSIGEILSEYVVNIDLDKVNLSQDYRFLNSTKLEKDMAYNNLKVSEYDKKEMEVNNTHFSKVVNKIIDKDIKKNMEFGIKIHRLFELVDFKNIDSINEFDISEFERKLLVSFLNQPLFSKINEANVFKEYEFYTANEANEEQHGIIDLMLEYSDHIDIIDYKLKKIGDKEYIRQLSGYKDYIAKKTIKPVNVYLYSILDGILNKID